MAEVVKVKSPDEFEGLTLKLDAEEAEFLYRLLGNHVVGSGKWRDISGEIFVAMDTVYESSGICYDELGVRGAYPIIWLEPNSKDEE